MPYSSHDTCHMTTPHRITVGEEIRTSADLVGLRDGVRGAGGAALTTTAQIAADSALTATYASPQGAWSSATAYTVNQVVTYNGGTYRAKVASTNVTPDSDVTKWEPWGGGGTLLDRGGWATTTVYTVGDVVTQGGQRYVCRTAHTAGTFATDLAASKWVALDPGAAVPLAQAASGQDPVALGVAAVGTQAVAARSDHVHPASSSPLPPMKVSTGWKTVRPLESSGAFGAPAQSTLLCVPLMVTASETWDRVGLRCSGTAAGSVVRVGIYGDNGNGYPGALLAEWGTLDTATATGDLTLTISQSLTPGLYWLASVSQGGAPSVRIVNATPNDLTYYTGATPFNFGIAVAFPQAGVTGSLPANFASTVSVSGASTHRLFVRVQ